MSAIVTCPNCGKKNRVPAVASGYPRCGVCKSAVPWIVDAGDADFAEVVEQAPQVVLVDLWATWCGPCRMVSPALEKVATERAAASLKLVKVDVDAAPETARPFSSRRCRPCSSSTKGTCSPANPEPPRRTCCCAGWTRRCRRRLTRRRCPMRYVDPQSRSSARSVPGHPGHVRTGRGGHALAAPADVPHLREGRVLRLLPRCGTPARMRSRWGTPSCGRWSWGRTGAGATWTKRTYE